MGKPTDELRKGLDELGVKWWEANPHKTKWHSPVLGSDVSAREWNGELGLDTGYESVTPSQAIAATLGADNDEHSRTPAELSKRLREVHGLHEFAELFGFDWTDDSDWTWHDVACAMADAVDAATVEPKITENTSDGWHSFKDLYHHRALLFSVIVHNYRDMCWKSKRHDDGTELDWNFIVGINTPWGQASYHYGMDYWDMFDCKVLERAPKYDGYTPEQSVERIAKLREFDASKVGGESDDATMLRLHDEMNAALLEFEHAMSIEKASGAIVVPFVARMHELLEDTAKVGAGTCHGSFHKSRDLSSGRVPIYYCRNTNKSIFVERDAKVCPLCGGIIKKEAE